MSWISAISEAAIPLLLLAATATGLFKNVPVYDAFVQGAQEGIASVLGIAPYLITAMCAITALRASGLLEAITALFGLVLTPLGFPAEALPLMLLRPLSGSASTAMYSDMLAAHSADSYIARAAGAMMGSTETIFYTMAVYCGAAGIKRAPYAVPAALIASFAGAVAAVAVCRFL